MHYILPEHRQLFPRHLHSLFEKDLSNPRNNSRRAKDIGINDIDIVQAGCLVDLLCDSVYWFYSLNLLGRTIEQFLNENKSEIYDLVDSRHAKSLGNRGITADTNHVQSRRYRGITADDTSHVQSRRQRGITADDTCRVQSREHRSITTDDARHVKSRGYRGITTDEWEFLCGSDTNVFHDKDRINHVSAKSYIMVQHLYEANVLLPRNLCPFKNKVDRISNLAIECDWIDKAYNDELKRASDEILSWLQCIDIMFEQGVYLNGPEMFRENTDLNHDVSVQIYNICIKNGGI